MLWTKGRILLPESEYKLKKSFDRLENLYREKFEKNSVLPGTEGSGKREYIEWDNLIVLDDVTGLADTSHSFVRFLTYCHKFGYCVLYISHKSTLSCPRWKDILSQTQIFCVFPSAMDLVVNHLVKFLTRGTNTTGYVSRQQLWLTSLVRTLEKQSGYSCFCLDKRPNVLGAARYKSQVESPKTQHCYLNSSTSDKLFNAFVSSRTEDKDQLKFVIEKQVGDTKDQSRWRVSYQEWTAATRCRRW